MELYRMKKTKIATIIPSLQNGGAERVASTLSLHFPENYEQFFFFFSKESKTYEHKGISEYVGSDSSRNYFSKMLAFRKRYIEIKRFKKKHNINCSISHLPGPNFINLLSAKKDKTILVIHDHTSTSHDKLMNIFVKSLYPKADKIIGVSKVICEDLVENYGLDSGKVKCIYNPIDYSFISKAAEEKISKEEEAIFQKPTIVNVARISRQKSQWHAIRAFKKLKERIPDAQFVLLGTGSEEGLIALKKLAKDYQLESDIHFLGFQSNPFKYLSKASLFLLSSLWEGLPMTIIESLVCGTPVVSTDCNTGPRELLSPSSDINLRLKDKFEIGEFGVLSPVCDGKPYTSSDPIAKEEVLLADAMEQLLNDEALRKKYKEKGKVYAKEFDVDRINAKYQLEIDGLCS